MYSHSSLDLDLYFQFVQGFILIISVDHPQGSYKTSAVTSHLIDIIDHWRDRSLSEPSFMLQIYDRVDSHPMWFQFAVPLTTYQRPTFCLALVIICKPKYVRQQMINKAYHDEWYDHHDNLGHFVQKQTETLWRIHVGKQHFHRANKSTNTCCFLLSNSNSLYVRRCNLSGSSW